MNKSLASLLVLALAALALVSCHENRVEKLECADALIYTQPDSSLALLQTVDATSLTDDDQRAYYALLWTQTAYRTGRFELATDSLAQAALNHYTRHPEQRERLVRAMIYMGLHREVNDQPELAMQMYKQAEATADTTDYRNLAQINYRIGQLLSNMNAMNQEDLRRFEKALYYYNRVGDTLQIIYSLLATGALLRHDGIAKARPNLEHAYRLARQRSDSANCARSLEYLARGYLKDSIHETAKDLAVYCVHHYPTAPYSIDAMLDAACAYALMGQGDSAQHYLDMAPQPDANQQRKSMRLFCLKVMARNRHDILDYIAYNEQREQLHDSLRSNPVIARLLSIDKDQDQQQRHVTERNEQSRWNGLLGTIALGLLALGGIGWYNHRRNRQQFVGLKEQIEHLKEEQVLQHAAFELSRTSDTQLNQRLTELLAVYSGLCDRLIAMSNEYPEKVFYKQFLHEVESFTERGELLVELQKYIDDNNDQAMTRFLKQHPNLDDRERGMIILSALGMRSSSIAVCLGLKNDGVVRSLRARLAKRLDLDVPLTDYLAEIVKNRPFI
ncbi:MAG: hypothetical protein IJ613_08605 [Muribaculaceae bacterium]|nr:hypothetical protein [Muribaculaceae bacterium]